VDGRVVFGVAAVEVGAPADEDVGDGQVGCLRDQVHGVVEGLARPDVDLARVVDGQQADLKEIKHVSCIYIDEFT